MFNWLQSLPLSTGSSIQFPAGRCEGLEWNPQLKQEHEVLEWLVGNPPLLKEHREARRRGART